MRFFIVFSCWFLVLSCGNSKIESQSTLSFLRKELRDTFLKLNEYDNYPSLCQGINGQPSSHLQTTRWFIKNLNNTEAWYLLEKDSNPLMKAIGVVRLSSKPDSSFLRMFNLIYTDSVNQVDLFSGCVGEPKRLIFYCLERIGYRTLFLGRTEKWSYKERKYVDSIVVDMPYYHMINSYLNPFFSVRDKRLPKPDVEFMEENVNIFNIEHEYFKEYFDEGAKMEVLKNFDGTTEKCGWKQSFSGGIIFEYEDCQEVGANVRITFPNYPKEELVKFVDWFYKTKENQWNDDKTQYSPIEEGAGCYFEILKDSSNTYVLDYYCGC